MSIISSNISNINSDGNELSLNVTNTFDYEFNEDKDAYFGGRNEPFGVVGSLTQNQIDKYIFSGYQPKIVATENVTVEILASNLDIPFKTKTVNVNYYIQTESTSTGGGGSDGDDDIREDIREDIR